MSDFKISFPGIPYHALTRTMTGQDEKEDMPIENIERGLRQWPFKTDSTATSMTLTYDMGSSITIAPDHFIIARADRLQEYSVTSVVLESSPDNSAWTTIQTFGTFSSSTLVGPRDEDFFEDFTAGTARRYWRVVFNTAGASSRSFSKLYFGEFFDMGVNVDTYTTKRVTEETSPFMTSDGSTYTSRVKEPAYITTIVWSGVTDLKRDEFMGLAHDRRISDCFLWADTAAEEVLDRQTLIHSSVESVDYRIIKDDWNIISATFKELIG